MPTWIVTLVLNFIVRQIDKWADALDWAKVKADADARIASVLPKWAVSAATDVVNAVIEVCAYVLGDAADLKKIVDLLQAGDVAGAFGALVTLIEEAMQKPAPVHVVDFSAKAAKVCDWARECQKAA